MTSEQIDKLVEKLLRTRKLSEDEARSEMKLSIQTFYEEARREGSLGLAATVLRREPRIPCRNCGYHHPGGTCLDC